MFSRLATLSMFAVLVLAGCGGGGGTIPADSTANGGGLSPQGSSILFERSTLWVAYPAIADAFSTDTSGSAKPLSVLGPWPWEIPAGASPGIVDIAIAPDGTKWVLENRDFVFGGPGWRLYAYERHSTRPENAYGSNTGTPMALGLAGDGIMVLAAQPDGTYAITTYPYASNFPPALRTFTSSTRIVSFAEGNDSRLYVARPDRVDVYLPTSTGCCPIRSLPVAVSPTTTGTHGFAVGPDNSIYVFTGLSGTVGPQTAYVNVYSGSTGALVRRIGPGTAPFDPLASRPAIAVDALNRLYVAANGQIYRVGAHAGAPERVWTNGGVAQQPVALSLGTPL
ncbi:MAG TPA: hypothetical protein VHS78_11310 [Candidatus Elarobacter sp.]|jgi:hypothetical protein|nr:hypothetical protein [Candidatus Elarobacter sp.]